VLRSVYKNKLHHVDKKTLHEKIFHPIPELLKHTAVIGPVEKAQGFLLAINRERKLRFQLLKHKRIFPSHMDLWY
jgi:hypothetical protein